MILFAVRQPDRLLRYRAAVDVLAERGHRIHIAYEGEHGAGVVEPLTRDRPAVTASPAPDPGGGAWPAYRRARRRAERERGHGRSALRRHIERSLPADESIGGLLEDRRPDLVFALAPLDPAARARDFLETARRCGIATAVCVDGWTDPVADDSALHSADRVFVWGETQRSRAAAAGIAPGRVIVTGAPAFDLGHGGGSEAAREDLYRLTGLDSARPFLVFAGSPYAAAAAEPLFVERWLRRIRTCDDREVASVGVLVRPHPAQERRYLSFDVSQLENVAVAPPSGSAAAPRVELDDAVRFSAGLVALDPSVLPDAVFAGRPFLTFADPVVDFVRATSPESLVEEAAALVHIAPDLDEHLRHLSGLLHGELVAGHERALLERLGLRRDSDRPAPIALADAIEDACDLRPDPLAAGPVDRLVRVAVGPSAYRARRRERRSAPDRAPEWLELMRPLLRAWIRLLVARAYVVRLWRTGPSAARRGRLFRRR